jgi:hypothetical protein
MDLSRVEKWLIRYLEASTPEATEELVHELKRTSLFPAELQVLCAIFKGEGFGVLDAEVYADVSSRKTLEPLVGWLSWEKLYYDDTAAVHLMVEYSRAIRDKCRRPKKKVKKK